MVSDSESFQMATEINQKQFSKKYPKHENVHNLWRILRPLLDDQFFLNFNFCFHPKALADLGT